jgi:hypothetical protein
MGQMPVFTNALEGRDDEFSGWHEAICLPAMLAQPPFTAAEVSVLLFEVRT